MHKPWNSKNEKLLLNKARKCLCGSSRRYIRQMTSIDGTEMGVVCLKCDRFALGADLTESVINWNNRQTGY